MVLILSRFMRRYQGLILLFLGFVGMVFMLGSYAGMSPLGGVGMKGGAFGGQSPNNEFVHGDAGFFDVSVLSFILQYEPIEYRGC